MEVSAGICNSGTKDKIGNLEHASSKLKLKNSIDMILRIAAIVIIITGLSYIIFIYTLGLT